MPVISKHKDWEKTDKGWRRHFLRYCSTPGCKKHFDRKIYCSIGGANAALYAAMRAEGWWVSFPYVKKWGKVPMYVCRSCQEKFDVWPEAHIKFMKRELEK